MERLCEYRATSLVNLGGEINLRYILGNLLGICHLQLCSCFLLLVVIFARCENHETLVQCA